jgi:hypothetical protein
VFLGAILLWPIGRVVVPVARIGGGAGLFTLGTVIGWLGLLLRWWSFAGPGKCGGPSCGSGERDRRVLAHHRTHSSGSGGALLRQDELDEQLAG